MTIETADRIIGFLEKYNGVYRDMVAFLTEKQAKVMADDLLWLLDSVEDEQALVMKIQSEESARSAFAASTLRAKLNSILSVFFSAGATFVLPLFSLILL